MAQYKTRTQQGHKNRRPLSPYLHARILERDQYRCFYCGYDATAVDHIVPYNFGGGDEEDNLVACCTFCNAIGADHVFDSIAAKRTFIRARYGPHLEGRARRERRKLSLCGDCCMVFRPNIKGASTLLCAECYAISETGRRHRLINDDAPEYDYDSD